MRADRTARARIRVTGRVQGVAFRHFTAEEAGRLRLAGTVRNLPDGAVEVEAEGPRPAVEVSWLPATGSLGPFAIAR